MVSRLVFRLAVALAVLSPAFHQAARGQTAAESIFRGDSLLAIGDVKEAEQAFRGGLGGEADRDARLGLARVYVARGRWTDAGNLVDDVLDADPSDLYAHYLRGICHREFARIGTPLSARNERQAEDHFEAVIRRDSVFKDVLYQSALQRFYAGDREEALLLAMRQVELKPEDADGQLGLFRVFRLLLHNRKSREALAWLDAHDSAVAAFFTGEVLRSEGRLDEARQVFQRLLDEAAPLPPQPIYLALARISFSEGKAEEGQRHVDRAIREIASETDARFVLEDVKYLLTRSEWVAWTQCDEPEEWIGFFEDFWARREPLPSSSLRVRLAEHYRRLIVAERDYVYRGLRSWHQLPDRFEMFSFPAAYYLNDALNDKGLVYVRHGEPSERVVTVGGMEDVFTLSPDAPGGSSGVPRDINLALDRGMVESWRYESPRMDFHFMVGAVDNGWFLTPTVSGLRAFEDREHWGGSYTRVAHVLRNMERDRTSGAAAGAAIVTGGGDSTGGPSIIRLPGGPGGESETLRELPELLELRDRLVQASHESVEGGLTSDRHTWTAEIEPIDMPYVAATFRGENGMTRLEVHYALPLGVLSKAVEPSADRVEVEVGMALHDEDWHPIDQALEVKRLPTTADMTAAVFDFLALSSPADSVQIAFHARTLTGHKLAGYRLSRRLPAYPPGQAGMSDLLSAYRIVPAMQPSRFNRHGFNLRVNPFGRFRVTDPVFVYFELYDLDREQDGRTRFTVEYTLVPTTRRKGLRRLFGGDSRPSLSLRFERVSLEDSPVEHAEIDVSNVAPGEYRLEVTVHQGKDTRPLHSAIPIHLTR